MSSSIAIFDDPNLGSAPAELKRLGVDFIEAVLIHCQDIIRGIKDYHRFLPLTSYRGVEMFRASIGDSFIVFSVEQDQMNDLKITIMFAGQQGRAVAAGLGAWDGSDYDQLVASIIQPRAIALFN
jgi:hypothetical protein